MPIFDQTAQTQLQEKLDYELWLLDLISNTLKTFRGGTDISTITIINRQANLHRMISIGEAINVIEGTESNTRIKVTDAMSPLTFTASYKFLDMIFEWILEENYATGNIEQSNPPSKWRFWDKINKIRNLHLVYPPLMQSEPYINDYLFALYDNLLKFRNEIVHRNNFSASDGKLKVTATINSQSY